MSCGFIAMIFGLLLSASSASAQTTTFTYQGRFTDGGTAANGAYDMQFKVFDGGGNQIGTTVINSAVVVSSGVFTVQLDFGASAFPGADRLLEIGVRPAGSGDPYTVLSPRQQLTSAVYAIRAGSTTTADTATTATTATNATQLGGVAASQYVLTTDPRLSNSGPGNYIQNTTNTQASSNFNISGNGMAGGLLSGTVVNATTHYNIGGHRVILMDGNSTSVGLGSGNADATLANAFFGYDAGQMNITGESNSFFGAFAGGVNSTGNNNSFFGEEAGRYNTKGYGNSFFGRAAGELNTEGYNNSFFGMFAGDGNTTGLGNSYFGYNAGGHISSACCNAYFGNLSGTNSTGGGNAFFGNQSGQNNAAGSSNAFFGNVTGNTNTDGTSLTLLGAGADVGVANLTNATAIGANARVYQSNSLVLGSIKNLNGAVADTNVGIGTTVPNARLHIAANGGNVLAGDPGCGLYFGAIGFGMSLSNCTNYSLLGDGTDTIVNRPTGGRIIFRENNGTQMTIASGGVVSINTLGAAGSTSLCRNASNQISTCSSSLRYKTNVQPFIGGLSVLNRLRPITFDWKQGGMHDLGFGAEDIAAVEPLLVTRNDQGEVEGVKYDRISAVLVNAVKEQQQQITRQQEQIKRQQSEIESLTRLVCHRNRRAAVCR